MSTDAAEHMFGVTAFDRNEEGTLIPAFKPETPQDAEAAIGLAKSLVPKHAGVIAWSCKVTAHGNERDEPQVLFRAGDIAAIE